jgi:hypothetical protein
MRDVNVQPQSWTVDEDEPEEFRETEAVEYSFGYARV